jgi:hypothetical protein
LETNGAVRSATTKISSTAPKFAEKAYEIAGPPAKKLGIKLGLLPEGKSTWRKPKTYMIAAGIIAAFTMVTRTIFGYKRPRNG